jgi:hypothetical protein
MINFVLENPIYTVHVSSSERPYSEYIRMPSPTYQYVINLVLILSIR